MRDDITLSMLTLRGARFDQPAKFSALERARAAKKAGFRSIGVEYNDPTVTSDLLDYVSVPELEWVNVDMPLSDDTINDVIKVALMLQATRLNAGVGIGVNAPVPLKDVTRNVGELADAMAPYGVTVALEPIAFGWLPKVADVCHIVQNADRPNLGLLLDVFHVHADPTWSHEMIPASLIAEVQLAGVPMTYPESSHDRFMAAMDRPMMAHSRMDMRAWLDHLVGDRGYTGPISYETPHNANANMALDAIARNVATDIATLEG